MGLDSLLADIERRGLDTLDPSSVVCWVSAQAIPELACTLDTPDPGQKDETLTHSSRWLIHLADHTPLELVCAPPAPLAEIRALYPDALTIEVSSPVPSPPLTQLSMAEETVIRAWLESIAETNPAVVAEVLHLCRTDAATRQGFLAAQTPTTHPLLGKTTNKTPHKAGGKKCCCA
jgi:hypothetical protein